LSPWLRHVAPIKLLKKNAPIQEDVMLHHRVTLLPGGLLWPGVILGIALPVDVDDHVWGFI